MAPASDHVWHLDLSVDEVSIPRLCYTKTWKLQNQFKGLLAFLDLVSCPSKLDTEPNGPKEDPIDSSKQESDFLVSGHFVRA